MRRISLWVALAAGVLLLLAGFHPALLPYFNDDARYSDAVVSHWPNALYLRQSVLEHGAFPLWRETIMAGQPFAANPLNKTAYPFQWLALLLPPAAHLNLLIVGHLLLAGIGMGAWARAVGLVGVAAIVSTVAYTLSPVLLAHVGAGHVDILYALAWWPWLMLAVRRVLGVGGRGPRLLLAVSAALLFLADVRVSLFAFLMAGGYAVYGLRRAAIGRQALSLGLAGGLFLWLTAALTVPLLAWSPYLSRAALTPADAGTLALQPGHLFGLLLFGVPPGVETVTYVGLPVLVLAVTGLWTFRYRWAGAAALLVILLYALGPNGPLWPLLTQLVPGLLWFRVPARAWLIVAVCAPLLAGYGWQRLIGLVENLRNGETINGLRAGRLAAAAFAAGMVGFGLFALLVLEIPDVIGAGAVFVGGVLGTALLLGLTGRLAPQRLGWVLVTLVMIDLWWVGVHWVKWRGADEWLDPQRPLAEALIADGAARVYSPTYSLEQQAAEAYGLRLFGGIDPFQLSGVVEAVEQGSGVIAPGYSVILPAAVGARGDDLSAANQDAIPDTQVLAAWDVSHVAAAYPMTAPGLEYAATINGVYVYRNRDYTPVSRMAAVPAWPLDWPGLPDAATVERLNQLTLTAALVSGAAWLVVAAAVIQKFLSWRYTRLVKS